jgi:NifU-like protein involved in Fe-S cluster formation
MRLDDTGCAISYLSSSVVVDRVRDREREEIYFVRLFAKRGCGESLRV